MDKFVVRTPRETNPTNQTSRKTPRQKQATIESLKGVVVIEEILRQKSILKVEDQSTANIVQALKALSARVPPRNVLQSTKIGHTVNKLTKHKDPEVANQAAQLVKDWKKVYEEKMDRPMIEVKCDRKTEQIRESGRKLINDALQMKCGKLAEAIEREVFYQHKRLLTSGYKRTMRNLIFTLRHQESVRRQVVSKEMEAEDFVKNYRKDGKKL